MSKKTNIKLVVFKRRQLSNFPLFRLREAYILGAMWDYNSINGILISKRIISGVKPLSKNTQWNSSAFEITDISDLSRRKLHRKAIKILEHYGYKI